MNFETASGQEIIDFFKGVEEIANKAHKDGLISEEVLKHANDVALIAEDKLIAQIKGENGAELEDAINKANLLEQKLKDVESNDMQTINDLKAQVAKLQEQLNNSSNSFAQPTAEVVEEVVAETIPQGVVEEDAVGQDNKAEVVATPTPTAEPQTEVVSEVEVTQPSAEVSEPQTEVVSEVDTVPTAVSEAELEVCLPPTEAIAEPTAENEVVPNDEVVQDEQSFASIILTDEEPDIALAEDLSEKELLDSDPS